MSKYLLNKFLFTVDRDPTLVERYRSEPHELVTWWESTVANTLLNCHTDEASTWLRFTAEERAALIDHDHCKLFELGAHPFLTLTLFIAMFERDNNEPLEYQKAYGARMAHFAMPYPDIAT
ncbi:hypothetical protein GCM10010172_33290 [Paractinoplanes ferrugineus]|uniref:Extradiol ring-cleavage dioxygenase LigAB LigA subunit domain-containing protein n=1 Tax=Paractinoplanes ferrugineus TaxID=113564 RepID=A0A919J598_9ACTN|nr:hypothetical protein [Actinoplanes ferrugineus]GIE14740.1 hypothetical protein Afe05nite_65800 [Actinoplanes ferrugineus]